MEALARQEAQPGQYGGRGAQSGAAHRRAGARPGLPRAWAPHMIMSSMGRLHIQLPQALRHPALCAVRAT